tara:strand:- start:3204 stop:4439 length:1236 start_codon:yes stop_codon:yes gene_type:complete
MAKLIISPGQVQDPLAVQPVMKSASKRVLFSLAFRIFFLLGAAWAFLAVGIWTLWFSGQWTESWVFPPTLWHAHEMIFGFAALIASGFLLTAVQTWTGLRSAHGGVLIALALLWLIARVSLLINAGPWSLAVFCVAQFGWWLGVIACFSYLIIKAKNQANRVLILLLSAMFMCNTLFVFLLIKQEFAAASYMGQSAIVLFCVLITLIGGRVIPFFTARALGQKQYKNPLLDNVLFWSSLFASVVFGAQFYFAFTQQAAGILILLSIGHLWRLRQWYHKGIWQESLLWSLHLSYLAMALGLLLAGLSLLTPLLALKDALHLISISAVSGMILSMMSRVSLGHTGRALKINVSLNGAFALLLVAGLIRALSGLTEHVLFYWQLSAWFWLAAFSLFLWHYLPILTRARIDGKPD